MADLMSNHTVHVHCSGCGACVPSTNSSTHHWCSACRERITAALPIGARLPWSAWETKLPTGAATVRLRSAQGDIDRVVISETPTMVQVTRVDTLEWSRRTGRPPASVWFKKTDIVEPGTESKP